MPGAAGREKRQAREGRYEAHLLATSHFDRPVAAVGSLCRGRGFESFQKVSFEDLDLAAQGRALPGPFLLDASWGLPKHTTQVTETTSGQGTRSHQERAMARQL